MYYYFFSIDKFQNNEKEIFKAPNTLKTYFHHLTIASAADSPVEGHFLWHL